MKKAWRSDLRWFALFVLLLSGCREGSTKYYERVDLPEDIVPLYGEAAAYKAKTASDKTESLSFDLSFLVKDSKVDRVVIVPYDDDKWYEPSRAQLVRNVLTAKLALNRNFLVALDLGEVARNNYQTINQIRLLKEMLPPEIRPKLCSLILCAAESFRADQISERIPEMKDLPLDFDTILPPVPIGPIGRRAGICDRCLERPVNIFPCLVWPCGAGFPVPRRVYVRKNIYTLGPSEIASLRAGVAAMKAKDPSDPTSWLYQARMHALDSGVAAALQDQCQHRQFFFFSWHRMFIYYFERILRNASGDPNLTLPYWNYTDVPAQGVLPEPFRLPSDSTNSLYDNTRAAVYNSGVALPAADVSYTSAFNRTNFTTTTSGAPSFGGLTVSAPAHFPAGGGTGEIEYSPHNNVHNDIGGFGGNMAKGESPRDPIFWLHHANIDRLWKRWIALGNGRDNPTGDTVWMNHVFTFFDENGAQVSLKGSDVLNTVTQLRYRYDDDPLVFWPFLQMREVVTKRVFASEVLAQVKQSIRLGEKRQDIAIPMSVTHREALEKSRETKFENEQLILRLGNIQYDQPVGITYMLFLNLPEGSEKPGHTTSTLIGTLGFFGKTEHGGGLSRDYDITRVVQKLGALENLRLTVMPSYPEAPSDRKDLQELVARMRPNGNPRFSEIVLLRLRLK